MQLNIIATVAICNSCNMAMGDLPDMYAQGPRAAGPRGEGMHTMWPSGFGHTYQANHE